MVAGRRSRAKDNERKAKNIGPRHQRSFAFNEFRQILVGLPATGEDGFEGLVAAACALVSSVPFRLVGSGRQFGRDGEGLVDDRAAILFEAKRYEASLSYHDLSGKLLEAVGRSGRALEVWAAAATVPFEAANAGDLKKMGEGYGVTVLLLDWTAPLPELAILLAAADIVVRDWFSRNAPQAAAVVDQSCNTVREHPLFEPGLRRLRTELTAGTLGLSLARRANADWMLSRFSAERAALLAFNQPLAPLDENRRPRAIVRTALEALTRDAIDAWPATAEVVILTGSIVVPSIDELEGDEGVGKTWAVARAWLTMTDNEAGPRPLLLFMASHMWQEGDERRPVELLARLCAAQCQTSRPTPDDLVRWIARLGRWLGDTSVSHARTRPTVIVVLDGVNERDEKWGALIAGLADRAREWPLRIVITSRRGSYTRNLASRLMALQERIVIVEAFSDADLDAVLAREGRDPAAVQGRLRLFLRNPRVLSVGVRLLDRLDPDEVGIERLLFAYLIQRQQERGLHASLTPAQLAQTLVALAREIRERLLNQRSAAEAQIFESSDIVRHVGAPPGRLIDDLFDIIDNQFISTDARSGRYTFTTQARSLGMALLVVDELQKAAGASTDLAALLDEFVDPIRAIDQTAAILLAALDVALADGGIDDAVAEELLFSLLSLQNLPIADRARIFAGLRERPKVYVAATERLFCFRDARGRRDWIVEALLEKRFDSLVLGVLDDAIRRWLRLWQPTPTSPDTTGQAEEQATATRQFHSERAQRHDAALTALTAAERAYVERELTALPQGWYPGVAVVAVTLLAGRALAPFASDLFAWCVAASAGWGHSAFDEMRWLRRLAPIDWEVCTAAIDRLTEPFSGSARSEIFSQACEWAWSFSGDPAQAALADASWRSHADEPQSTVIDIWREACGVDPLDPNAEAPVGDLDVVRQRYSEWFEGGARAHALMRHVETAATQARRILCRFDPGAAADSHIAFARSAHSIDDAATSVLASFITEDAAILGRCEADILLAWLRSLRARRSFVNVERGAPALLLHAILPHLPPEEQYEAFTESPDSESPPFWLETLFLRLPDVELAARLSAAASEGSAKFRNALIFAGAGSAMSNPVRSVVAAGMSHEDSEVRGAALRTMLRAGSQDDRSAFAAGEWRWSGRVDAARAVEDFCGSICLAQTLGASDDCGLLDRIHPAQWSRAVLYGGEAIATATAKKLLLALCRAGDEARPPTGISIGCSRADEAPDRTSEFAGLDVTISYSPRSHSSADEPTAPSFMQAFLDFEQRAFDAGRGSLIYPPSSAALDRIAVTAPLEFERLVSHVEGVAEGPMFDSAVVIASDLARILSHADAPRAARLFARFADGMPIVAEEMPLSGLPRQLFLLWRAAPEPEIVQLRARLLDAAQSDDVLAHQAVAAAFTGNTAEMKAYVLDRARSLHPATLARALTLAGFSPSDDAYVALFADNRFEHGFLSNVRDHAAAAYRHALWARHWCEQALEADDAIDTWRYSELAIACVDGRCALWFGGRVGKPRFERLRPFFRHVVSRWVENVRRSRQDKLFGERAPPSAILSSRTSGTALGRRPAA